MIIIFTRKYEHVSISNVHVYKNMYMQDLLTCHTHVKNGASQTSVMLTGHTKQCANIYIHIHANIHVCMYMCMYR